MTRSGGRPGGPGDRQQQQQQNWDAAPRQTGGGQQPEPIRVDFGKRAVALVIDVAAGYFLGVVVAMIPFVNAFLPLQLTMVLYFLTRDYFFEGRGVGKNFMGLQVVDVQTEQPPTIIQSVQRNIILLAPFVVLQLVGMVLRFVPIAWLNDQVVNLVNLVGMVYCAVVIPMEAYRVYSKPDGARFGDELAGTKIIEARMDFSNIVPRQ